MRRQLLLAALLALPLAAAAQSYRCVGKDGKKYYGQSVPPQCVGQSVEQLNAGGMVVKNVAAVVSGPTKWNGPMAELLPATWNVSEVFAGVVAVHESVVHSGVSVGAGLESFRPEIKSPAGLKPLWM